MQIIRFSRGDRLQLKKKHPCGSSTFLVLRGGTDVRICCEGCKRELTVEREAVEKMIRKVIEET